MGRSVLAAGGLALGGGLLAACGKQAAAPPAAPTAVVAKKTLRISNWPLYIREDGARLHRRDRHQGGVQRGHQRQQRVFSPRSRSR